MTDFDASDDPFGSQSTPKRSANNDFDDFLAEPQPTVGKSSAPPMDDFFAETSTAPVVAAPVVSAPVVPVVPVENALTRWQAERRAVLQKKMAASSQTKRDIAQVARNELENFYSERRAKITKNKVVNREEEKAHKEEVAAVMASGTEWEKVAKYCDLIQKGKETSGEANSRIRLLLIDLKNDTKKSSSKPAKSDSFF